MCARAYVPMPRRCTENVMGLVPGGPGADAHHLAEEREARQQERAVAAHVLHSGPIHCARPSYRTLTITIALPLT